jgi:glycosyltransferase involved in cell wall biosynthesis
MLSGYMISIVIPTRNRADLLAPALHSLTRQTFPADEYEVLVIDNGSTDQTALVVQDFSVRLGNLRYFYEPEPGLHAGRHRGMLEAHGELLVFADDDIEAFPSWLASISEAFADPGVAMVGGNNLPLFLEPPPAWLERLWDRPSIKGDRALPALSVIELSAENPEFGPHLVWGCNFAIRKNVLLAAGGFHPDGMPKDLIRFRGDGETHVSRYVAESGKKCVFHPGASVYHKVTPDRMSFAYFWQRGFNQGVSDSYARLRNQDQPVSASGRSFLQRAGGAVLRGARDILIDQDVRQALAKIKMGHREGYSYHQKAYREDPEVRAWVHKPTYF